MSFQDYLTNLASLLLGTDSTPFFHIVSKNSHVLDSFLSSSNNLYLDSTSISLQLDSLQGPSCLILTKTTDSFDSSLPFASQLRVSTIDISSPLISIFQQTQSFFKPALSRLSAEEISDIKPVFSSLESILNRKVGKILCPSLLLPLLPSDTSTLSIEDLKDIVEQHISIHSSLTQCLLSRNRTSFSDELLYWDQLENMTSLIVKQYENQQESLLALLKENQVLRHYNMLHQVDFKTILNEIRKVISVFNHFRLEKFELLTSLKELSTILDKTLHQFSNFQDLNFSCSEILKLYHWFIGEVLKISLLISKNFKHPFLLTFSEFLSTVSDFQLFLGSIRHISDLFFRIIERSVVLDNSTVIKDWRDSILTELVVATSLLDTIKHFRNQHEDLLIIIKESNLIDSLDEKSSAINLLKQSIVPISNLSFNFSSVCLSNIQSLIKSYDENVAPLFSNLTTQVSRQLTLAVSTKQMLKLLETFSSLLSKPAIRSELRQHQSKFLQRLHPSLLSLKELIDVSVTNNSWNNLISLKGISRNVSGLFCLFTIKDRSKDILSKVKTVFGVNFESHVDLQSILTDERDLSQSIKKRERLFFENFAKISNEMSNCIYLYHCPICVKSKPNSVYSFSLTINSSFPDLSHDLNLLPSNTCDLVITKKIEEFSTLKTVNHQLNSAIQTAELACSLINCSDSTLNSLYSASCRAEILAFRNAIENFMSTVTWKSVNLGAIKEIVLSSSALYCRIRHVTSSLRQFEVEISKIRYDLTQQSFNFPAYKSKTEYILKILHSILHRFAGFEHVFSQLSAIIDSLHVDLINDIFKYQSTRNCKYPLSSEFFLNPINTRLEFQSERLYLNPSITEVFNNLNVLADKMVLSLEQLPRFSMGKPLLHLIDQSLLVEFYSNFYNSFTEVEQGLNIFYEVSEFVQTVSLETLESDSDKLQNLSKISEYILQLSSSPSTRKSKFLIVDCKACITTLVSMLKNILSNNSELISKLLFETGNNSLRIIKNLEKDSLFDNYSLKCFYNFAQVSEIFNDTSSTISLYEKTISSSHIISLCSNQSNLIASELLTSSALNLNKIIQKHLLLFKRNALVLSNEFVKMIGDFHDELRQIMAEFRESSVIKESSSPSITITLIDSFLLRVNNIAKNIDSSVLVLGIFSSFSDVPGLSLAQPREQLADIKNTMSSIIQELSVLRQSWYVLDETSKSLKTLLSAPFANFSTTVAVNDLEKRLNELFSNVRNNPSASFPAYARLTAEFKQCLGCIPLLRMLASSPIKKRHLIELSRLLSPTTTVDLREVLMRDIFGLSTGKSLIVFSNQIDSIISRAHGESSLEAFFFECKTRWNEEKFKFLHDNFVLLSGLENIQSKISDDVIAVESLKKSPYASPFSLIITEVENFLLCINQSLSLLFETQSLFVSLQRIASVYTLDSTFSTNWSLSFKNFNQIIEQCQQVETISQFVSTPGTTNSLENLLESLTLIQKSLLKQLEEDRKAFPRLYFIGDFDLLSILSTFKYELSCLSPFLPKIFAGISELLVDDSGLIVGVKCSQGEILTFSTHLSSSSFHSLPSFLHALHTSVTDQLKFLFLEMYKEITERDHSIKFDCFRKLYTDWFTSKPSQLVLIVTISFWTKILESNISNKSQISSIQAFFTDLLIFLSKILKTSTSEQSSLLIKLKIKSILPEILHLRDSVSTLLADFPIDTSSHSWKRHLRCYFDPSTCQAEIKLGNSCQTYGWEFFGIRDCLVRTPLISSVFDTFLYSLSTGFASSPCGPAGTGKTEAVRALGTLLGRYVLVFNADNTYDIGSVARILVGICESGSWCCFDEFNRLTPVVLSAVSTDLFRIQSSIQSKIDCAELSLRAASLHPFTAVFVTMNPSSYKGRSELPANLSNLFRKIMMVKPDLKEIVQTLFISQGFSPQIVTDISEKLILIFEKCASLFMDFNHYDFGLRSIKKTILRCSDLLNSSVNTDLTSVLLLALSYTVRPKLAPKDSITFSKILYEVFGSVALSINSDEELIHSISIVAEELNLSLSEIWRNKVIDLCRIIPGYHGILISGASGSGKTQAINLASKILGAKTMWLDPLALGKTHFIGEKNLSTGEWTDGVFTKILRSHHLTPSDQSIWVILDSVIDPDWIESLNSLLDDNQCLSLLTGERIPISSNIKILIKTPDTRNASLATVSRLGTVFFTSDVLGFKEILNKFLVELFDKSLVPSVMNTLSQFSLFDSEIFTSIFEFISLSVPNYTSFNVVSLASSFAFLLRGTTELSNLIGSPKQLSSVLFFLLLKSFASFIPNEKFSSFYEFLLSRITLPMGMLPLSFSESDYNQHVIIDNQIQSVSKLITSFNHSDLIATPELVSDHWLISALFQSKKPIILIGDQGVGKSALIQSLISSQQSTTVLSLLLSKTTTISSIKSWIISQSTVTKGLHGNFVLKPQSSEFCLLYLKSLGICSENLCGYSVVNVFLRNLLVNGSFIFNHKAYTLQGFFFIFSSNHDLLHFIPANLFSLLVPISVQVPSTSSLSSIYNYQLKLILNCNKMSSSLVTSLTTFLLDFYHFIQSNLIDVSFSMTDISQFCNTFSFLSKEFDSFSVEEVIAIFIDRLYLVFACRLSSYHARNLIVDVIKRVIKRVLPTYSQSNLIEKVLNREVLLSCIEPNMISLQSVSESVSKISSKISDFDSSKNFVITAHITEHLLLLDSVLRLNDGHVILTGQNGQSKSSLIEILSSISDFSLMDLSFLSKYSLQNFIQDFIKICRICVTEDRKILLRIFDYQLFDESILFFVNSFVSDLKLPHVIDSEMIANLIRECVGGAAKLSESFEIFNSRLAKNLKICVCTSTVDYISSSKFTVLNISQENLDSLQSFIHGCLKLCPNVEILENLVTNIDLPVVSLPKRLAFSSSFDLITSLFATLTSEINSFFISINKNSVSKVHLKSFISLFSNSLSYFNSKFSNQTLRAKQGLNQLNASASLVSNLTVDLARQHEKLNEKNLLAKYSLENLIRKQKELEDQQEILSKTSLQISIAQEQVAINKKSASDRLENVLPALEEAQNSLRDVRRAHLNELQSMTSPPDGVILTIEAITVALGLINDKINDWSKIRSKLRADDFISLVLNFDAKNMPDRIRNRLCRDFLSNPAFNYENIRTASKTCGILFKWLSSQINYANIEKEIGPLKEECRNLEEEANQLVVDRQEIERKMIDLEIEIAELKQTYSDLLIETESIKNSLLTVSSRSDRAQQLLSSFEEEKIRWRDLANDKVSVQILALSYSILFSGLVSFSSFLDVSQQKSLTDLIERVIIDFGLINVDLFSDPLSLSLVFSNQISRKVFSNLIVEQPDILHDSCTILTYLSFLDPFSPTPIIVNSDQKFGSKISTLLSKHYSVSIISMSSSSWLKSLEHSIRFGHYVILTVESLIDPVIVSLLDRSRLDNKLSVEFNGKLIECSPAFRLCLLVSSQSKIQSFIQSKCRVISFELTFAAVESNCLQLLLSKLLPDTFNKRLELTNHLNELKSRLVKLEDDLLARLDTKSSLLDDEDLLKTLENIKIESSEVKKMMVISTEALHEINQMSANLIGLSTSLSKLWSLMSLFSTINSLYSFNYQSFVNVIVTSSRHVGAINELPLLHSLLFLYFYSQFSKTILYQDRPILFLLLLSVLFESETSVLYGNKDSKRPVIEASLTDQSNLIAQKFESDPSAVISLFSNILHEFFVRCGSHLQPSSEHSLDFFNFKISSQIFSLENVLILVSPRFSLHQLSNYSNSLTNITEIPSYTIGSLHDSQIIINSAAKSQQSLLIVNVHVDPNQSLEILHKYRCLSSSPLYLLSEIQRLPSDLIGVCDRLVVDDCTGISALLRLSVPFAHSFAVDCGAGEILGSATVSLLVCLFFSVVTEYSRLSPFAFSSSYSFTLVDLEYAFKIAMDYVKNAANCGLILNFDNLDWHGLLHSVTSYAFCGRIEEEKDVVLAKSVALKIFTVANTVGGAPCLGCSDVVLPLSSTWDDLKIWINELPDLQSGSNIWLNDEVEAKVLANMSSYTKTQTESLLSSLK
ncbi:hypothetical protein RCL1_000772 [Eukaryota sp. TZLM3-RCL]